ncbi:uncharacterized protein LOC129716783 [Wyeomyia smithii]|uniref:uncharacterized protein LOC129716783 n=1 Tax=Wyeomyia smithii TaxID=174621 RepID=UPI002467E2C9|nr:uncharacterized protein LOC129716783 [Wyeomyia smithii]
MDKGDYDTRVYEMIASGPYEEYLYKNGKPKDPLNAMIEGANITRQRTAHLMGEEKLERRLLVSNPKVASLYCLPKIHKNPLAMRPISSNVSTPMEKMAAWVVNGMKHYPISHGASVKNSVDLVEQLKGVELRMGEILVSFDVKALFPSVPVPDAIQSFRGHLERSRASSIQIEAYTSIVERCMDQNFFTFRGKFYRQKRYVDDVFAIVEERHLEQTLELLNTRHPTIKFTVEQEVDKKLPFLDLIISRKPDNSLKFGIYRKPTSTDRYITSDSNHCGAQKQAAFHSMAHRLVSVPMEKDEYTIEKEKIKKAAKLNGYDEDFVEKIIRTHERKQHKREVTTLQPEKENLERISMPFYAKVTNRIKNALKRHGYHVTHKSENRLRDLLCNAKDKIPSNEKSGIYKIECQDCAAVYIGQTRRKFKVRLKEHKKAVANKRANESSVASHAISLQHNVDWDNAKILKNIRKSSQLNAWESMHIMTSEQPLMNEDDAPILSPLFHLTKLKL